MKMKTSPRVSFRSPGHMALALLFLPTLTGCPEKPAEGPKPCCDQPKIPDGVPPFKVVADEVSGAYDERVVKLRAVLSQPVARKTLYPVLHTLYRHVVKRELAEPLDVTIEVFANEAAVTTGTPVGTMARTRGMSTPECENHIPYTFAESADLVFGELFLRRAEEDPTDSCKLKEPRDAKPLDEGFSHRPSLKVDSDTRTLTLHYPFLKDGEDAYPDTLKFTSAMKAWTDYTTAIFRKLPDLERLDFYGIYKDEPVLRIILKKDQFYAHFSGLQEDIAAYAAVTFQKLGMNAQNQAAALKEQEQFHGKTYRAALAKLPKDQVTIAKNLK